MNRKRKVIFIISGLLLVIFIVLTVVSEKMYIDLLPKVTTYTLRTSTSKEGVNERWVPKECIFKNGKGEDVVYVVRDRQGRFKKEFYTEEIPVDIKENREDGYVLLVVLSLGHMDPLVIENNIPVSNQGAVKWMNKEAYDKEVIR